MDSVTDDWATFPSDAVRTRWHGAIASSVERLGAAFLAASSNPSLPFVSGDDVGQNDPPLLTAGSADPHLAVKVYQALLGQVCGYLIRRAASRQWSVSDGWRHLDDKAPLGPGATKGQRAPGLPDFTAIKLETELRAELGAELGAEIERAEAGVAAGLGRDFDFSALAVDELGALYAALVGWDPRLDLAAHPPLTLVRSDGRKRSGAFYTPPRLARRVVERTIGPLIDERRARGMSEEAATLTLRLCDPAVGCGHFLLAAARYLGDRLAVGRGATDPDVRRQTRRDVVLAGLHGVDRDPLAVEIARALLWIEAGDPTVPASALDAAIRVGDSLDPAFDWPRAFPGTFAAGGFDAVIGNPPFGNAIEARTARGKAEARRYHVAFPDVTRGAYDRASLFLGLAPRLLAPEGRLGLVCPRATASARGAAAARAFLFHAAPPRVLWCPNTPRLFGAASVFVCVVIAAKSARPSTLLVSTDPDPASVRFHAVPFPATPEPTWWSLVATDEFGGSPNSSTAPLGDAARIWAGCTAAVAYELGATVEDGREGTGPKLLTTGAIDRYKARWGERRIRFLHHDYPYPRWPSRPTRGVERARDRQRRPKLLVGGLCRVVEAVLDQDGGFAGPVGTLVVVPRTERVDGLTRLLAVLNSARFSFQYFQQYGAKQLSGGNCTIGKVELFSTAIPADTLADSADLPLNPAWRLRFPNLDFERAAYWGDAVRLATWLGVAPEDDRWRDADARLHAVVSALYGLTPVEHDAVFRWWRDRQPNRQLRREGAARSPAGSATPRPVEGNRRSGG